jgi:nucleotide-binding universal stress UspA family protein
MSVSQGAALTAIASQLASALVAYETEIDSMAAQPQDLDAYRRVSGRMDQMRLYASAMPQLSVPWVELLIRHFELTHGIWQLQQDRIKDADLIVLRHQHHEAVQSVSSHVRKVLACH